VIFQHSAPAREARHAAIAPALPFWLVLVVFEAALWLLLSLKFRQPATVTALAAGLTLGVAVQMARVTGVRGALSAVALTALTCALVLYAQAAFHVARALALPPLDALASTGPSFALAVLDGRLSTVDFALLGGGLMLAALFGSGVPVRRRAASAR
jgi:hypothetical protein